MSFLLSSVCLTNDFFLFKFKISTVNNKYQTIIYMPKIKQDV